MKILITDTDTKITSVLKNGLNQHEIEVRDSLDNDYISNFNCVIIQSQSNKCDTPEDLNLKTQKTYNILSSALQRRYRQELINGIIDQECLSISINLLKKLT